MASSPLLHRCCGRSVLYKIKYRYIDAVLRHALASATAGSVARNLLLNLTPPDRQFDFTIFQKSILLRKGDCGPVLLEPSIDPENAGKHFFFGPQYL